MTGKILRNSYLVAISALLASALLFFGVMYRDYEDEAFARLRAETSAIAQGLGAQGASYFDGFVPSDRVTWVDASGSVLYDSAAPADQLSNHTGREEIDRALARFQAGDYLILQNEINGLDYLMTQAARQGLRIVFNPSPIDESIFRLPLGEAWLLIFNEIEGAALAGCDDEEDILNTLRRRWPRCRLLLTLGSHGCVYDNGQRRLRQGIYQVGTVDTTAAGDTFTGYFVACMAAGRPEEECLDLASRAAAIAVSRPGAAPSIPTMDEVQRCTLRRGE